MDDKSDIEQAIEEGSEIAAEQLAKLNAAPTLNEAIGAAVEGPPKPIVVGGKKKGKRRLKDRKAVLRKEQWYRMTSFFDGDAKAIMQVGAEDVILCGWVPPDNDCALVLVPPSITQEQGLALQKMVEANLRKPVLILTNNTQLVRLKPIHDSLAEKIMKGETDDQGQIIQVEKGSAGGPASEAEGSGIREEDSSGDAGDLRSTAPTEQTGCVSGERAEGLEDPPDAPEGE